jgi:hypothetical protein
VSNFVSGTSLRREMCSYVDAQTLPLISLSFQARPVDISNEMSETAGEVRQRHTPEERIAEHLYTPQFY